MHEMDNTPKVLTIIALILEGLGSLIIIAMLLLLNLSGWIDSLYVDMAADLEMEIANFETLFYTYLYVIQVLMSIYVVFFIINLVLFIPMIKGKYTNKKARSIYLYQAIWGGFNILSNQIVGILYLVSGVQGRSGHREMTNIREGI